MFQPTINNVTQCCIEQNVSSPCQDACSFFLDIDAVIDKTECINDFSKLMKCAAGRYKIRMHHCLQTKSTNTHKIMNFNITNSSCFNFLEDIPESSY